MAVFDIFKNLRRGRRKAEPHRDSIPFPNLMRQAGVQFEKRLAYKPTPRNLRFFSYNPYARRAINAIKNPIAQLDWEILPKDDIELNSELERQIEVATFCFNHPNNDDSFRTLIECFTEDILCGGGAVEMQIGAEQDRPLFMWPVDGLTINLYPGWTGKNPREVRYVQIVGYGNFLGNGLGQQINLRNDELIYVRPNPSSATPFGHGPLEIAFNTISALIGVGDFAHKVSSNAKPSFGVDLGQVTPERLNAFENYWRNEVEGQGKMPITGMTTFDPDGKPSGLNVYKLYPEGDKALFLEYQDFLKRELAMAFDLAPQELGIEKDVNRNTAEVGEDRTRQNAIAPYANLIEQHFTRDALHLKLGFSQLQFKFKGIEAEDELNTAQVYEHEYKNNAITPNEYREQRGMPPLDNEFADKCAADVEIAIMAARGAAMVDPDAEPKGTKSSKPAGKSKSSNKGKN